MEVVNADIADASNLEAAVEKIEAEAVVHLAAQPGVRYSIDNPRAYIDTNLVGFGNVLEVCRRANIKHLVYASSSSVYGANVKSPFSVSDPVDHPISLYAATKKANELMAHTYSHLFGLPTTGLRFFTAYGPWGRPDMATWKFVEAILDDKSIDVYNKGEMKRDFTYIDDVAKGVVEVLKRAPKPDNDWDKRNPEPGSSYAPFRVYNLGNNRAVKLLDFIGTLEEILGKKAEMNLLPLQAGDVLDTCADIDELMHDFDFRPQTELREGLKQFVDWFLAYREARPGRLE